MGSLFQNQLHQAFGTWPLGYIPYGGADFGEIRAVADAVGDGDDVRYYEAWTAFAARLESEAQAALGKGHAVNARESFLRAAAFYGASYHPLYGAPVDPRLLAAYRQQIAAFERGLALGPHPVARQHIVYGDVALPAYLIPAIGYETQVRPLIIFNGGYDSTVTDMYFGAAVAASRRGYHSLLFDGPGQGAMLYEHGVPFRPDWEAVIKAVVDFAVAHPLVDGRRIAISGMSLGGHLAPRAASGESRIAAVIADPGTWSIADGFRDLIRRMFSLPIEAVADLGALDQAVLDKADAAIRSNREIYWKVVQRGFWTHGVSNLRDYLASAELFTMAGRAELIRCPTLITQAEGDILAVGATGFFDALRCPKTLLHFTAQEGADGHCEMQNRSLINRRALDWLDEQFQAV
ncbi:lysophospholipase [Bosea sp. Root381]|uniref:alpha/beta hydrolase family protein n=1 Tax=Bosea sp. Root381 TaxID=1736524 RepID=UPI0006F860B2|nr:alpha/beta fold hydrolase [Bosea sp. Root381]KRE08017.1 lysophospholipase [Bosea sp. Root381]